MEQPKGPFCQSCGMPMEKPEDFGMNADGVRNNDYCHFCLKGGCLTAYHDGAASHRSSSAKVFFGSIPSSIILPISF